MAEAEDTAAGGGDHQGGPTRSPGPVPRLADALGQLRGRGRAAAAFAAGGLATLALPPANLVPCLLIAIPLFVLLLDGCRRPKEAFWAGWWFGFGHFLFGLYWISFALLVDAARFWWMVPFAAAGLPAFFAFFPAAAGWVWHRIGRTATGEAGFSGPGIGRVLLFAVLWSASEWLRGHMLTGFPWHLLGYAWVEQLAPLQSAALIGIYGLSLITVTVAALPALFAMPGVSTRRAVATSLFGAVCLGGLWFWGADRIAANPPASVPGVGLRLVQPNLDQAVKWAPSAAEANFQRHLMLSASEPAPDGAILLVIWPETAATFFLEQDMRRRLALAAVTPDSGYSLVGAPRVTLGGPEPQYWNSLLVVDRTGAIAGAYEKFHLVPFGEYMPLRKWFPEWLPVNAVAAGSVDFSAGPGPRTLDLDSVPPFSPLICYEAIFPGAVTDGTGRAAWLLNITNDAWYGRSAGPHQHFAIARVRAVEEGIPLVRVANTGISGIVDPIGRVTAQLGLEETGVLDTRLPVRTAQRTPYSRYGDGVYFAMLGVLVALVMLSRYLRQTTRSPFRILG